MRYLLDMITAIKILKKKHLHKKKKQKGNIDSDQEIIDHKRIDNQQIRSLVETFQDAKINDKSKKSFHYDTTKSLIDIVLSIHSQNQASYDEIFSQETCYLCTILYCMRMYERETFAQQISYCGCYFKAPDTR